MNRCKARYDALKANGICVKCGQADAVPGRVLCLQCHTRIRAGQAARYARLKAEGRCTQCGALLPEKHHSTVLCDACHADALGFQRATKAHQKHISHKSRSICVLCGQPVEPSRQGLATCQACHDAVRKNHVHISHAMVGS